MLVGGVDAGANDTENKADQYFLIKDSLLRYAHSANIATDVIDTSALYATPEYWRVTKTNPEEFGLDSENNYIFIVMLDTHFDELPHVTWENASLLRVGGESEYVPLPEPGSKYLSEDVHHSTAMLQFPKVDARGKSIIDKDTKQIELMIMGLEGPGDHKMITWKLPITYPEGLVTALPSGGLGAAGTTAVAGLSLATLLAFLAGFIIVLSPCLVDLVAIYITLITGITTQELMAKKDEARIRIRVIVSAVLFVSGFTIVYVFAGAIMGSMGQLIRNSETIDAYMRPITIAAGLIIIYLALQVSGVLRLPFLRHLHVPLSKRSHGPSQTRTGYAGSFLLGFTFSIGCLQCVGGAVVASMLIYAGTTSMGQGALLMFLYSMGVGIPFLLMAAAFTHTQSITSRLVRFSPYVSAVSGLILLTFGVLIVTDNMHLLEALIFHRLLRYVSPA